MLKYFPYRKESCASGCVPLNFSKTLSTYEDYFNTLDDDSQGTFDLIARKYNFDKKLTFISNKKFDGRFNTQYLTYTYDCICLS